MQSNKIISRIFRLIILFSLFLCGFAVEIMAHPSPNSAIFLKVHSNRIDVELQLPISELQLIFGQDFIGKPEEIIPKYNKQLTRYILQHFRPTSLDNRNWGVILKDLSIKPSQQLDDKFYQDLSVHLQIIPPKSASVRAFNLNYDVIIHQVATHSVIISIRQDWESGVDIEEPTQIGIMSWDVVNNVLPPFKVNLQQGSVWKGFQSMINLGIQHIAEGTDHLLFLLVLLIPAPLFVDKKRWIGFGGNRYSMLRLFKIVTAFTVGHSITLLIGSLGLINPPSLLIEILIAVSILISASHAIRPIFTNREMYIASGFGLIHGLAFASSISNLSLSTSQLVLSILGFNIGTELMQLFIVAITFPWFILLSKTSLYPNFRALSAVLIGIAAIAWIIERIQNEGNFITILVGKLANQAIWLLVGLVVMAVLGYFKEKGNNFYNKSNTN